MRWGSRFYRSFLSVTLLALLALSFPHNAIARPAPAVTVHFEVIAVTRNTSVTIRTKDFPLRTKFVVRIGTASKKAVNGEVVGSFNSDKGGVLEQTFPIPVALKDVIILGLRIESADGYEAYNWFFNETLARALPAANAKPQIDFSEAKKNTSVTVQAKNLPANTSFSVRVGPYEGFYAKYAYSGLVKTGAEGAASFPVSLPASAKDAEHIMVRMDGAGTYVFNVYKNVDGGKAVPLAEVNKVVECQIISINPIPALAPREDFDVIWSVQNSGLLDWEMQHVMFLFVGGTAMQKYQDRQTLPFTIKRGKVHEFVVDMRAPEQSGWYTAIWMIKNVAEGQNKDICKLSVSVFVK